MKNFITTLKETREAKKISLETVSKATKISISLLNDIENFREHKLPEMIFLILHIKSYANFLGIEYNIEDISTPIITNIETYKKIEIPNSNPSIKYVIIAIILIIAITALQLIY